MFGHLLPYGGGLHDRRLIRIQRKVFGLIANIPCILAAQ